MTSTSLSALSLVARLVLLLRPGMFWRIDREPVPPDPESWPDLVAVILARNEEEGIGETLRSLWRQEYPARLRVVVVDDEGEDRSRRDAVKVIRERAEEESSAWTRGGRAL